VAHRAEELPAAEKRLTHVRDEVNTIRRELPMVKIDKPYALEGPDGRVGLADLFEGRRQLIVYHFMFDPSWNEGCKSCSFTMDGIGHRAHLHARDTTLALVSQAPLTKLTAYRTRMGWTVRPAQRPRSADRRARSARSRPGRGARR
jgi:predicted dithiol-disulfide oxidoreductase (DUF899 family)